MNHLQENFHELYRQHHLLVFNVALNYLQNVQDAEEITQDVFVQLHKSLESFNEKSALKTWIYRITINKCLDFSKQKNAKKRLFIFGKKSAGEKEYHNAPTAEHPGIILENKEKAAILFATINELTENQKTAFLLSKVDGLPNAEIAAIMELSISSVESLVFRAKSALREKLAAKFEEYRKNQK